MFDLKGKTALVTGGNGGIGFGMAQGLAKAGARVVIAARNVQKSEAAVNALQSLGAEAYAVAVNVSGEDSVQAMVDETLALCGRIDILVNNAGVSIRGQVQNLTLNDWHRVLDTNLTGVFLCSRSVHPHMKKSGGGKVINIGSMLSIFGSSPAPAYSASKGGVVQLTKSMALAWAADNIQVNAVLPGWIDTELTRNSRKQSPDLHAGVLSRTPAGRWGNISDLEGIAVFLSGSGSDFITGAAIPVDGGYSACG